MEFLGSTFLNLDVKNRLTIPTKYREDILSDNDGEVVLTGDHAGECLVLYPYSVWLETKAKIKQLPNMDAGVKGLNRTVLGLANKLKIDKQGRLLVAETLRNFVDLDKKVVLVGQDDKFEIWKEESWTGGSDERISSAKDSIANNDLIKNFSI